MNTLGIDVDKKDVAKLWCRLGKLKTTHAVYGGAEYLFPHATGICQVLIDTDWTEKELDDWLYRTKHGAHYHGVFTKDQGDVKHI